MLEEFLVAEKLIELGEIARRMYFADGAISSYERSCFGNVVAEKDAAENEKFTKEKARGRIDGAVAAAMAIGRILETDEGPSVYEPDRPGGFLWV